MISALWEMTLCPETRGMQSTTRQSRGRGDQSPPKPSLSTLFTLEQPQPVTGGTEALKPEPFNTNSVYFTSATASHRMEQRLPWWELGINLPKLRNRWWVFSCSIPTYCGVMRLFQKPAHLWSRQGPWKKKKKKRTLERKAHQHITVCLWSSCCRTYIYLSISCRSLCTAPVICCQQRNIWLHTNLEPSST